MNSSSTLSATWGSIVAVMNSLGAAAVDFMLIVQGFVYAAAIFFLVISIMLMVKTANPSARGSMGGATGSAWFWSLVVAVLLFALPETMSVFGSTLFPEQNTSALAYSTYLTGGGLGLGSCQLGGIRPLLVVFGYVAFVRGLMVMRTVGMYGSYSRGNATFWRGMVLLCSGVALVHMQGVLSGINSLTGLSLGEGLC